MRVKRLICIGLAAVIAVSVLQIVRKDGIRRRAPRLNAPKNHHKQRRALRSGRRERSSSSTDTVTDVCAPSVATPKLDIRMRRAEDDALSDRLGAKIIEEVKEATSHAWQAYRAHAWGHDALKPLSQGFSDWASRGVSILDSMSTLWLLDMKEEFEECVQWVSEVFARFEDCSIASFFEQNIRVIGGLLSAASLSGDARLMKVVRLQAPRIIQYFQAPRVIPPIAANLCILRGNTGSMNFTKHLNRGVYPSDLAQAATNSLEFRTMGAIQGLEVFNEISDNIIEAIVKGSSLLRTGFRYIPPSGFRVMNGSVLFKDFEGCPAADCMHVNAGGGTDSYFEYFLKTWLQSNKTDHVWKALWKGAIDEAVCDLVEYSTGIAAFRNAVVKETAHHRSHPRRGGAMPTLGWEMLPGEIKDAADLQKCHCALLEEGGRPLDNSRSDNGYIEHLSCFLPGNIALGLLTTPVEEHEAVWFSTAKALMQSCAASALNTRLHLPVERVTVVGYRPTELRGNSTETQESPWLHLVDDSGDFDDLTGGSRIRDLRDLGQHFSYDRGGDHYGLRPEIIESLYYMYILTRDPIYRHWGFLIWKSIQEHCRIPSGGYASVRHCHHKVQRAGQSPWDDTMESFFFAETLKYVYLLFSPADSVDLSKWVFNTEGHPLPVIPGGFKSAFNLSSSWWDPVKLYMD